MEKNRFELQISKNNHRIFIEVYDTHKRQGYGIYTEKGKFMCDDLPVSISNLKYFFNKLNEYYDENQALKNSNDYHALVLSKLDRLIDEFNFYFNKSLERYTKNRTEKDRLNYLSYMDVVSSLEYVKEELQGEDYE